MKAECARTNCTVRDRRDRNRLEARAYEGHDLAAHQLVLIPLYAHTQHGGCGLHCTLDGEAVL